MCKCNQVNVNTYFQMFDINGTFEHFGLDRFKFFLNKTSYLKNTNIYSNKTRDSIC